jgi:hypothetical protein
LKDQKCGGVMTARDLMTVTRESSIRKIRLGTIEFLDERVY